ncbi:MAG: hypothetical protein CMD16_02905 [Flavobacteriales bacterium]|nr:hypothetical protein [Flavobacteriales bacterium]|tara:strand:+ start:471 stop:845 length:375 start_codon:yes stop_codon:yes gene_type:complete
MIGFGQSEEALKLRDDVNDINYRMEKHHQQFYKGAMLNSIGVGSIILGVSSAINPITYIGSAFILAGNIVMINSHKWFKNSGNSKYNSRMQTIKEKKRELKELLRYGKINQEEYNNAIKKLSKQ